jgi:hypothetical protein
MTEYMSPPMLCRAQTDPTSTYESSRRSQPVSPPPTYDEVMKEVIQKICHKLVPANLLVNVYFCLSRACLLLLLGYLPRFIISHVLPFLISYSTVSASCKQVLLPQQQDYDKTLDFLFRKLTTNNMQW